MIAIQGGNICTMEDSHIIENGTVLVEGQWIRAVGEHVPVPDGAQVIDARGRWVLPGLIDAHTHIGLAEEIYSIEGDDVNEMSDPVTPHLRAVDGLNFWDVAFSDALGGGVTRTMCMPGSANIVGGQALLVKTWASGAGDLIYKEPWGLKAALGENPKRVYGEQKKSPMTRMASAALLRENLYTAMNLPEGNHDDKYFHLQPLQWVLQKKMPLLVHAHRADDILTALRIKEEFDIDMVIQHGTEAMYVAEELKKQQVPVCLGPLLVNRAKVEMKDVAFRNAARLHEKGVPFCLVTDHPVIPIEHLRTCAALTVREGLPAEEALKSITINPAKILKIDQELGSLKEGKRADIVIYDEYPLHFTSKVITVIVDGQIWRD